MQPAGEPGGAAHATQPRHSSSQVLASLNALLRQPILGGGADGGGGDNGGPSPPEQHDRQSEAQDAEKAALDDFLVLHARRYDFSQPAAAAEAFGATFSLLVSERFLSKQNWGRMLTGDFRLRVLQCMRVLMRDGNHRRAFAGTPGAVGRLCGLCVELARDHLASLGANFASEMLVETLSILKRFAALQELWPRSPESSGATTTPSYASSAAASASASRSQSTTQSARQSAIPSPVAEHRLSEPPSAPALPSPLFPPDLLPSEAPTLDLSPAFARPRPAAPRAPSGLSQQGGPSQGGPTEARYVSPLGARLNHGPLVATQLHGALVALLSTREALVLQCVLVALYQFVQVEHHRAAIGCLGCAEILLRILSEYEPSFKVLAAELLELLLRSQPFCREVIVHDGASTLLSLLHSDDAHLPPPLLRSLRRLASDPPSAKEVRQLGGINVLLSLIVPNAVTPAPPALIMGACAVLTALSIDHDAALQARKANGIYILGTQLLALTAAMAEGASGAAAAPQVPLAERLNSSTKQLFAQVAAPPAESAGSEAAATAAHVCRALRYVYSMERNRKVFRRLFPPDLFAAFIDVGQYVESVAHYVPIAAQLAGLSAEARAKIAEALGDVNTDRGGAEQLYVRDYAVQELLGKGGFGSVYQVKGSGESLYAMKELPMDEVAEAFEPHGGGGKTVSATLLEREVGILSSLQHPNIIRYFDSFVEKGNLYILMELVDGATLLDHINSFGEKGAFLTEERIWHIFYQVCMALRYCHKVKHVVHRDLTPSNIMISDDLTVKLADFGLARQRLGTNSVMESVVGSVLYQCPELIQHESYGEKADIWALGCILYQMATLRPPFEGGNPLVVATRIVEAIYDPVPLERYSALVVQTIGAMLSSDPARRPDIDDVARLVSPVLMAQLDEASQERVALREELRVERDARLKHEREAQHHKEAVHRLFARHQLDLAAVGSGARGVGLGALREPRDDAPLRAARPPRETTRSPMLSVSPNRIREIHDPCSRILHQLHKILFITQLPPTVNVAPERLVIEKYKHALFSRRNHARGWSLKDELNKLLSGSDVAIDLAFHVPGLTTSSLSHSLTASADSAAADRPKHRLSYEELQRCIEQVLSDTGYYALQPDDAQQGPAPTLSAPKTPDGATPPPLDRGLSSREASASPAFAHQALLLLSPQLTPLGAPSGLLHATHALHPLPGALSVPSSVPARTRPDAAANTAAAANAAVAVANAAAASDGRASSAQANGGGHGASDSTPKLRRPTQSSQQRGERIERGVERERSGGHHDSPHPGAGLGGRRVPQLGLTRGSGGGEVLRGESSVRLRVDAEPRHGAGGGSDGVSAAMRERPPARQSLLPKPGHAPLPPVNHINHRPPSIHIPK